MCEFCDKMKKQTGYRGQKYAVYYTRDGEESLMGWQNEPSGGLEDVAKIMPGVTSTRVAPVHSQPPRAGLASFCSNAAAGSIHLDYPSTELRGELKRLA